MRVRIDVGHDGHDPFDGEQQGVSVGWTGGGDLRPDHATSTDAIVDDNRLAQSL